jgi:hypothetical protein
MTSVARDESGISLIAGRGGEATVGKTDEGGIPMKLWTYARAALLALPLTVVLAAPVARAESPKTYQVTGPITELTDSTITVQKGKEKWQIARDKDAKITGGDLKVGSKVTIEYTMTAKTVEVKGDAKTDTKTDTKKK